MLTHAQIDEWFNDHFGSQIDGRLQAARAQLHEILGLEPAITDTETEPKAALTSQLSDKLTVYPLKKETEQ